VAVIQSGAIGKVKEVHTWSNKKWGDPNLVPDRKDPVPATLHWDLWLGVASERPYVASLFHPSNWRKRLDFGTGTFGDMGCHIYDPVFEAIALSAPISVTSEGPAPNRDNWANDAIIKYVFPGTKFTDGTTVRVTWYDGDQKPSKEIVSLLGGVKPPDQGSIFVGTKGTMLLPHVANPSLYPQEEFKGFVMPKVEQANHYHQFVDAVRGMGRTTANFDYSGALTEAVLLGGVATHFPKETLEWEAAKLTFKGHAKATEKVRRTYRKGWEVKGLSDV
jgi:predicted dehydrogenase